MPPAQKFGKSTGAAVWLDPERTSPYAFYQYWLTVDDRDAGRYLRLFTFLDRSQIEAIEAAHAQSPELREAQHRLAQEMTVMVHGEQEWRRAVEVSAALFGKRPARRSRPATAGGGARGGADRSTGRGRGAIVRGADGARQGWPRASRRRLGWPPAAASTPTTTG